MNLVLAPLAYTVDQLPAVNAALNAVATVLLVAGYVAIRQRREHLHKILMLSAFCVSVIFLVSYLIYHAQVGSRPFGGPEPWRTVYLAILIPHIVLAASVPVLATLSIYLGLRDRRTAHRKVVRWTLPIWLYVSVTGVVVYWMLYHLFPVSSTVGTISQRPADSANRPSVRSSARFALPNEQTAEWMIQHDR